MKSILSLLCLTAAVAHAGEPPRRAPAAPTRDAATSEQLVEIQRQAREQAAQSAAKPADEKTPDPAKASAPESLMSRSEVLCFEGIATLVPKRAIINRPKVMEDRLQLADTARLVPWVHFFEANRGWVKTMEVTRKQAEGKEPFSEETLKSFQGSSTVVVATYGGAPVSVLPLKTPEPAKAEAATPAKP